MNEKSPTLRDLHTFKFEPPKAEILSRAVDLVISACKTAFDHDLECVTLKGSAVRGDFIQGYSDFDFHVFLKSEAMDSERVPKIEGAMRFQKAFGDINPEDYGVSQFQIYFVNSERYPSDWIPAVEGTYKVFWGNLPSSARERDDSVYIRYAKKFLSSVEYDKQKMIERFVDKPNTRLPSVVRLLGATLKGHMYSVSVLLTSKPKFAFTFGLDKLIPLIEEGISSKKHFTSFFEHVINWFFMQRNYSYTQEAFREGIMALEEIAIWSQP